jgi:hypothetical protein
LSRSVKLPAASSDGKPQICQCKPPRFCRRNLGVTDFNNQPSFVSRMRSPQRGRLPRHETSQTSPSSRASIRQRGERSAATLRWSAIQTS